MNWDGDLYGDVIRVRCLLGLRREIRFPSLDALKEQIGRDRARAERYFESARVRNSLAVV